ncbi:MAG: GvpL/GvpF family gas vesicle protein [Candidatus Omnitrophota bacterium]
MSEIGRYIYGVVGSNAGMRLFVPMESVEKTGTDLVYTIPYRDISAVVCDLPVVECACLHRDALARLLVRHQKVLERIMALEHTVIPMRLGTFAQEDSHVEDVLRKGYPLIKDVFKKAAGKIEIDVAVTWSDFTAVLNEIGKREEISRYKQIALSNPGGVTVEDQMKIGVMVKKALDERREGHSSRLVACLSGLSEDFRAGERMDDKMVMNCAFLVDKTKRKDFDNEVEGLNAEFNEKLKFRCIGPLPPYSFYTLEIKKINFEQVIWAQKRFGLNDVTTEEEIKKAHHALSLSAHPDKNSGIQSKEGEFDEITKAHKILIEYYRACMQEGHIDRCFFDEKDFNKNAVLVKIKD